MSGDLSDGRARFPVGIECTRCKSSGAAIWEEAATTSSSGLNPRLVGVPDGFTQRQRQNLIELPEIVCKACGTVVAD